MKGSQKSIFKVTLKTKTIISLAAFSAKCVRSYDFYFMSNLSLAYSSCMDDETRDPALFKSLVNFFLLSVKISQFI